MDDARAFHESASGRTDVTDIDMGRKYMTDTSGRLHVSTGASATCFPLSLTPCAPEQGASPGDKTSEVQFA